MSQNPQDAGMAQQAIAFFTGFGSSAALIIAIGAQNAFVLRQGLKREYVGAVVAFCALSDALLISAGVAGLGSVISASPWLLGLARYGGAAFLLWYGISAARRALSSQHAVLAAGNDTALTLRAALLTCAGFTFLNPHVYLDTVVLLGALSSQQTADARPWFALGAICASFAWFSALGFGARLLTPVFSKPLAWRLLDGLIAMVMLALAFALLLS
jgi:L-lysine exporter family protein LysE/ArgO